MHGHMNVKYLSVFEIWGSRTGVKKNIFYMKPDGLVNTTDVYKDLWGSSSPIFYLTWRWKNCVGSCLPVDTV